MSSSGPSVSVRGLSKSYTISHDAPQHTTVAEALLHRLKKPMPRTQKETFWALRDVSFEIPRGDVVGIIGRNGAGKSTLLKVLSRITEPTSGEIDLYGRVGSLLEVGTGFHPELTGRENIYLNGAILGMSRREIRKHFDAIVDFADVEQFLDTPVKRYSSGMYVRLAFAVAAHLEPEIMIVDEVLAVGDTEFQKKCLGKMQDVAHSGRTVLFVSHNMAAVSNLCTSCILLQGGQLSHYGRTEDVIGRYLAAAQGSQNTNALVQGSRPSWARPLITAARLLDSQGEEQICFSLGSDVTLELTFDTQNGPELKAPVMGVIINHATLGVAGGVNTRMSDFWATDGPYETGILRCHLKRLPLLQGHYSIDLWLGDGSVDLDCLTGYLNLQIEDTDVYGTGRSPFAHMGMVYLEPQWQMIRALRESTVLLRQKDAGEAQPAGGAQ